MFDPSPISNEPAAEPAWLKPVEIIGDVPPVTEDAFPEEPGLVIADLNAAKEVEPHAAELEVAPEPIEIVTMVLSVAFVCLFVADEPLQTKEDPKHIPEESAKVAEPVVEVEDIPTAEPKVWSRVSCTILDRFVHHCPSIGDRPSRDRIHL